MHEAHASQTQKKSNLFGTADKELGFSANWQK